MLLKNGPPCEASNVVVYDANTNENIFSSVPESGPEPVYKPPVPRAPHRETGVPLNPGKENQIENSKQEEMAMTKSSVPKERGYIAPRTQKNFLKTNKQTTMKMVGKKVASDESQEKRKNYGKVPKYLQKIN